MLRPFRPRPLSSTVLGSALGSVLLLAACPAKVHGTAGDKPQESASKDAAPAAAPAAPAGQPTLDQALNLDREPPPRPDGQSGLGSGKPDETNGICRLYAPNQPDPTCCETDLGFDAELARKECGFDVYLGESFMYSCGYFFHREGKEDAWIRLTQSIGTSAKESADSHDMKMSRVDPNFKSTPVPGAEGAYWSSNDGLSWAFIPGWGTVRQLAWRDEFCSKDQIAKIIAKLIKAKPVPTGTKRTSLVPTATY